MDSFKVKFVIVGFNPTIFLYSKLNLLEICEFWGAREWNYVAEVAHSCYVADKALKAQAETGMWHCAVLAQVKIPPVVFRLHAKLFNAVYKLVVVCLAL